jgi:hypothetical protein
MAAAEAALQPLRALLTQRLARLASLELPLAAMLDLGALAWARDLSAGVHLTGPDARAALRAATARRYSGAYKALERGPHAVLLLPGWLLGPGERRRRAWRRSMRRMPSTKLPEVALWADCCSFHLKCETACAHVLSCETQGRLGPERRAPPLDRRREAAGSDARERRERRVAGRPAGGCVGGARRAGAAGGAPWGSRRGAAAGRELRA